MDITRKKNYTYFIGIDVSKNKLDYAVFKNELLLFHKVVANTPEEISQLIIELKKLPGFTISKSLFLMEFTGIYCNHLLSTLKKAKANFAQANALQIRNSFGLIRGKNDKLDAIRIGRYAVKFHPNIHLWEPKRAAIEQLSNLVAMKNRLQVTEEALKKPINEQRTFVKKGIFIQSETSCNRTLEAIAFDLEGVDKQINSLIKSDERIMRLNQIITSIPNVGPVTSLHIILTTNEFKTISNPKKYACFAGIAPFKQESGLFVGKAKISQIANKKTKSLLHMCAIATVRKDSELKDFYIRKTEDEKKPKMSVINAIRYKLLLRIFSCVKEDRLYSESYTKPAFNTVMS